MRDLEDLAAWMKDRDTDHNEIVPSTLPDPTFICDGRELV